jgi:hypothetical protein
MPSPADDRRHTRRADRPPPPAGGTAGRPRLDDRRPPSRRNPRIVWAAVLGGALVSLAILIALFSGSSENTTPPPAFVTDTTAAPQVQRVDGTLSVVSEERLVLEPFSGGAEMEFTILPEDLPNFDIAHMQSHSSVALPTRIFYERSGDRLIAKYKEDAPANSRREAQE